MFDPPKWSWKVLPTIDKLPTDEFVDYLDRTPVEWFLRRFRYDFRVMLHLREVLAHTDPVGRFTDDEVIETIAWKLASHELVLRRKFLRIYEAPSPEEDEDGDSPALEGSQSKAEGPDPDTFPGEHDAQAGCLRAAAQSGAAFCQQCEQRGSVEQDA